MEVFFATLTQFILIVIKLMALAIVTIATVVAFAQTIRHVFSQASPDERREIWLHYARWLVAALTFQLAADIIESSIATNWQTIGRLAAIAVIRTFLNYFLERDVAEVRERRRQSVA